ncbi:MAG: hypothetical protein KAR80_08285 [Rhodospirillaceae bacterium]|nr:hypothetical protein [Rhodospirillaceae bacterium]
MNEKLASFIDNLPTLPTLAIGIWMGLAPFAPEPHLVQKFLMAINGDAFKLIDVFDVFMHGGLGALAGLKIWRILATRGDAAGKQDA